jgi:hypothetical protein
MNFGIDLSDMTSLARDLEKVAADVVPKIRPVFQEAAEELKVKWRANATETAGRHGKWYPDSITYETRMLAGAIEAEIGPDLQGHHKQGGMSFEFGSVNQPPHLDGQRAADVITPHFGARIDVALAFLAAEIAK